MDKRKIKITNKALSLDLSVIAFRFMVMEINEKVTQIKEDLNVELFLQIYQNLPQEEKDTLINWFIKYDRSLQYNKSHYKIIADIINPPLKKILKEMGIYFKTIALQEDPNEIDFFSYFEFD